MGSGMCNMPSLTKIIPPVPDNMPTPPDNMPTPPDNIPTPPDNIPTPPDNIPTEPSQIDPQVLEDIKDLVRESASDIPNKYYEEHKSIVLEMKKASPGSYKGLLFSEYPDKNLSKVNEQALINVTKDDVQGKIAGQINDIIQPKLQEKLANKSFLVQQAIYEAVRKTIEKAVSESFDKAVEKININDAPPKSKK
ncbi:hypothetical protein I4U23_003582 [Adineta vaga]|nr:hypothetical protein I4U23_003582 [Adineta vaga]